MENRKTRIALADDHILLRNALKELIHTFGPYEVIIEADNGRDLLDKIAAAPAPPDLCVLDVSMPVMDGYETQVELRKNWPDTKTLVLSQYNNEFTVIRLLKEGASGYLLKSAAPDEFKRALESVLNNEYYHPEMTAGKFQRYVDIMQRKHPAISKKEMIFLGLCCSELTYKDIGEKMGMSTRTIDGYRDSLFEKLRIKSRSGLVMYALTAGIVPLSESSDIAMEGLKEKDEGAEKE
ncbi:MAG: hypothetical protein BGO69_15295 [Bacteroidetes bacterium 46-16]|nr:MAG: hypothetical protein BGO69_15295 [Bacteroidetes bacterium 46-16]